MERTTRDFWLIQAPNLDWARISELENKLDLIQKGNAKSVAIVSEKCCHIIFVVWAAEPDSSPIFTWDYDCGVQVHLSWSAIKTKAGADYFEKFWRFGNIRVLTEFKRT